MVEGVEARAAPPPAGQRTSSGQNERAAGGIGCRCDERHGDGERDGRPRQASQVGGREAHAYRGRAEIGAAAAPAAPRFGTTTCSPSASGAARLTWASSALPVAPPALATASAIREPCGNR